MTAWKYFQTLYPDKVIYIDKPIVDLRQNIIFCYDHNINCEDGFIYENGKKKIRIINNIPFCYYKDGKNVMFCGLHFQGRSKLQMIHYYYGKKNVFTNVFWRYLTYSMAQKMKDYIKRLFK